VSLSLALICPAFHEAEISLENFLKIGLNKEVLHIKLYSSFKMRFNMANNETKLFLVVLISVFW
jgi:hypothetical protein